MQQNMALSVEDQEYERLVNAGMQESGEKKKQSFFVPTVEMSNSVKEKNGAVVPMGHFRLTQKLNGAKVSEDLGDQIAGVVLKVRYHFESKYDPTGKAPYFFSQEFDTYNDQITVLTMEDKKVKPFFVGSYKEWLKGNSFEHPQTKKRTNLFDTYVDVYVLEQANFENPRVYRVKMTGKSMGNYFEYMNGNKMAGIKGLHEQLDKDGKSVHLHTHLHVMSGAQYLKPDKTGYYAAITFSFADRLQNADIVRVVQMQRELSEALRALEKRGEPADNTQGADVEYQEELPTINLDEEEPAGYIAPVEEVNPFQKPAQPAPVQPVQPVQQPIPGAISKEDVPFE